MSCPVTQLPCWLKRLQKSKTFKSGLLEENGQHNKQLYFLLQVVACVFLWCEFSVAETLLKASGQWLQWTSDQQLGLVGDTVVLSEIPLYRSSGWKKKEWRSLAFAALHFFFCVCVHRKEPVVLVVPVPSPGTREEWVEICACRSEWKLKTFIALMLLPWHNSLRGLKHRRRTLC